MTKELEPYCSWPEHFDREGNDLEGKGCPVCFWWTLCWLLADAGVNVKAPMDRR